MGSREDTARRGEPRRSAARNDVREHADGIRSHAHRERGRAPEQAGSSQQATRRPSDPRGRESDADAGRRRARLTANSATVARRSSAVGYPGRVSLSQSRARNHRCDPRTRGICRPARSRRRGACAHQARDRRPPRAVQRVGRAIASRDRSGSAVPRSAATTRARWGLRARAVEAAVVGACPARANDLLA